MPCTNYFLYIIISTTTITSAFLKFSEHSGAAQSNYYRRSRISEHRKRGAVLCTGRCWLLCFVHCLLPSLPSLLLYVVVACNLGLRRTGAQSCHCSRHWRKQPLKPIIAVCIEDGMNNAVWGMVHEQCVMSGCYIPWGRFLAVYAMRTSGTSSYHCSIPWSRAMYHEEWQCTL